MFGVTPRKTRVGSEQAETTVDVLGEPYLAETIPLPPDDEGEVVATLVRRPAAGTTTKAVLHLHGFADYFFQTEYAEWWADRGYDFYALDLRKYGRSLRPHQTPNYITDLTDYYPEMDAAWQRITERDGHSDVVISAHSTGGLVVGLWADDRRPAGLTGAVMNSPWLDLQGSALLRVVGTPILKQLGARQPKREIKRHVTGLYTRSLHRDHEGEWDFDLLWKPIESFTVYAGWLRAVREGHARQHRGLELPCPVLVLSSGRSAVPAEMGDEVHGTDIVLDVAQIRRWATAYGRHVTYVAVEGARHDVVLSREAPRRAAYDAISTWMTAWVDPPKQSLL
jgi:alpha-beta hydrolase superfamily lysophospholipase